MSIRAADEGLTALHQRLEAHFALLRSRRDQTAGPGVPLFALEHGLTAPEMTLLTDAVHAVVRRRYLPWNSRLPFVVARRRNRLRVFG